MMVALTSQSLQKIPKQGWEAEMVTDSVDENDEVLISGFGRKGKAKGDIPGVRL